MRTFTILDLYCCAGGAAKGYHDAGFWVIGVDSAPQKNYPFAFLQADVLSLDQRFLRYFDAIHASPPCQFTTSMRHAPNTKKDHLNLIPQTRAMLVESGKPYIIENVEDAREHLIDPVLLCGSMFELGTQGHRLQRHRLFETNWTLRQPPCAHTDEPVIGVYGGHGRRRAAKAGGRGTKDVWEGGHKRAVPDAMGMNWGTLAEISEAIPPAYTHWIGERLMESLTHD